MSNSDRLLDQAKQTIVQLVATVKVQAEQIAELERTTQMQDRIITVLTTPKDERK